MTNQSIHVSVAIHFLGLSFLDLFGEAFLYLPIFAEGGQLKLVKLSFEVSSVGNRSGLASAGYVERIVLGKLECCQSTPQKDSSVSVVSESISKMPNLFRLVNYCILVYPVYQAGWKHGIHQLTY